MALIAYPAGAKTVEVVHELWSPNQVVIPLLGGGEERFNWAPARWRGTFTLALADRGDASDALELFAAEFSTGRDWVEMPWPKRTIAAQATATRASGGTWTVAGIAPEGTAPGRWVRIGNRLHQIRTVAGDLETADATTLTLIPDVVYDAAEAQTLDRALTARVRCQQPTPVQVSATRFHSGPVTFPFVEHFDG